MFHSNWLMCPIDCSCTEERLLILLIFLFLYVYILYICANYIGIYYSIKKSLFFFYLFLRCTSVKVTTTKTLHIILILYKNQKKKEAFFLSFFSIIINNNNNKLLLRRSDKSRGETHDCCEARHEDHRHGELCTRCAAKLDLHLLGMIADALWRALTIEPLAPCVAHVCLGDCLDGLDAQLLAAARAQRVHNQQYQIRVANLLHAERPVFFSIIIIFASRV